MPTSRNRVGVAALRVADGGAVGAAVAVGAAAGAAGLAVASLRDGPVECPLPTVAPTTSAIAAMQVRPTATAIARRRRTTRGCTRRGARCAALTSAAAAGGTTTHERRSDSSAVRSWSRKGAAADLTMS